MEKHTCNPNFEHDLERYLCGVMAHEEATRFAEHAASCGTCGARLRQAREEGRRCAAEGVPAGLRDLADTTRQRPSHGGPRWWSWRPVLGLGLAAVVAVLVIHSQLPVSPSQVSAPEREYVGEKGRGGLMVYTKREGQRVRVHEGMALHPGEALYFVPVSMGFAYVSIALVEDSGEASLVYPSGEEGSAALPENTGVEIPGAVVLDGHLGSESIVAVFSDGPLSTTEATARANAAVSHGTEVRQPAGQDHGSLFVLKIVKEPR